MARLRAVVVVAVVLVLGAWSCQVPTDSAGSAGSAGATVASGVTTTGLTSLLAGEDWHYVGEAGEPAFENSWINFSGYQKLSFRIREGGIVDLYGVTTAGTPGAAVFTLPAEYRPSSPQLLPSAGLVGAGPASATFIRIQTTGVVSATRWSGTEQDTLIFAGSFYLNAPAAA